MNRMIAIVNGTKKIESSEQVVHIHERVTTLTILVDGNVVINVPSATGIDVICSGSCTINNHSATTIEVDQRVDLERLNI